MTPVIGQVLGHYRIEAKLGEGGMGVVYRAFDTHLDRPVAIKILRADATSSPERKRRFVQEAKAASALNHPNIVHIYDISSTDGTDFIAMEFVAGKTLDQLIGKSGLPLKDTLKYSIQIADALARAHAAGIVHRDLKPANIIVSEDGRVKLLDFGLAKLTEKAADSDDAPTMTNVQVGLQTEEGTIVGTVVYMSPEQAEGKRVDARSDIFSFGSVLYEMVSGRRPFEGASNLSTLSSILHREPPPLGDLAPNLPVELEKIIARCLRKDPERRAQHVGDIKLALEELREDSTSGKQSPVSNAADQAPVRLSSFRLAAIVSGIVVLLAVAGVFWWQKKSSSGPARADWVQITNFADSVSQPALSPDGRMLTFIRGPKTFFGPGQVYVKMLPSGDPVQLTHDDLQKMSPAFSPDGSRIAYTSGPPAPRDWDTWVVPVLGGEPRLWLPNASGLVWIDKSKLLFSEIKNKAFPFHMAIVTAEESRAGSRDIFMPPHERGMAHRSYLSPDGKSILLVEMNERGDIVPCRLVPVEGNSPGKQVGPPGATCTFAAWSPDGKWMYFSANAGGAFHIWRQHFPDGQPDQVTSGPTEEEGVAMAPDGHSLLTAVGVRQSSVWVHDSHGDRQISLEGQAFKPRLTPDGKKLCYLIRTGESNELWVADLDSNRNEPLLPGFPIAVTGSVANSGFDVSPDSRQLVFYSPDREGKLRLWLTPLDRRSPPRQIPGVEGEQPVFGSGGEIFFRKIDGTTAFLYSVREDGTGLQRAAELPLVEVFGMHPNRQWLFMGVVNKGPVIFSLGSGALITPHLYERWLRWTGDGKQVVLAGPNDSSYVLPLTSGEVLPGSLAIGEDSPSVAGLAKVPGVRTLPVGNVEPGPTADIYAFTRESVQRNVYRIPLP
jgi:eukaryotic-like serine/threonine-protein kinase